MTRFRISFLLQKRTIVPPALGSIHRWSIVISAGQERNILSQKYSHILK